MKKNILIILFGLVLISTHAYPEAINGLQKIKKNKAALQALPMLVKAGESDPIVMKHIPAFKLLFLNPNTTSDDVVTEAFKTAAELENAGRLQQTLAVLFNQMATQIPQLQGMSEAQKQSTFVQFYGMVRAEVMARGAYDAHKEWEFKSWSDVAKDQNKLLSTDVKTTVDSSAFKQLLEKWTGSKFQSGNLEKAWSDGPASFARRSELIEQSKFVWIASWAFYNDRETGLLYADKLVAAFQKGKDVRVMVDGNVAAGVGMTEAIQVLEKAGVPVVRFKSDSKTNPAYGTHRKFAVFDGQRVIQGGRNFGNDYSNLGPAGSQKWRDMDVEITGDITSAYTQEFVTLWNSQVKGKLAITKMPPRNSSAAGKGGKYLMVDHVPNPAGIDAIYMSYMQAIQSAKYSIDIENAYVILTPGLRQVLLDAIKRGVKVRVITNSAQSVDEPIVSIPILQSAKELADAGASVYLKNGFTLHAKFMLVDSSFSIVGSYNLHPRSLRYEGENVLVSVDEAYWRTMKDIYENDLKTIADPVTKEKPIVIPASGQSDFVMKYFFDQL